MLDAHALLEKLRRIEALHAGATTPGERDAAENAIRTVRARLAAMEKEVPAIEHRFGLVDAWSRKLFLAIARRYGLKPYRYSGQKRTTVMLKVPKAFVDETLWPRFEALNEDLRKSLAEETDRVIAHVFGGNAEEAEERAEPAQLLASPPDDA
jgi:hypothetical protein